MKQRSLLWQAAGFAAVTFGGTLLHFLYEWTGKIPATAVFSGVNESTWEHMKLLFWPLLLWASVQRRYFKSTEGYWSMKLQQILLGLALIPVLFYTCTGMFGKLPDWFNIAIFYISAALVFLFERRALRKGPLPRRYPVLPFAAICLTGLLFAVFTFAPPRIPLFRDPVTGSYGIPGR